MIQEFVSRFTSEKLDDVVEIRKKYYLVNEELISVNDKIVKSADLDPFSIGVFLGEEKKKKFLPSMALVDWISKHSDKKVYVDDNAEWLFLCGKDVFGKSVVKANVDKGLALVQNNKDENLGYGKLIADPNKKKYDDKVVLQNTLDKGMFLRMEMS